MKRNRTIIFLALVLLSMSFTISRPSARLTRPQIWAAKVFQSGENAPVPTVVVNELGVELTITRDAAGVYTISSPSPLFIHGKVFLTASMGDAFTAHKFPKIFNFSNNPNILKLFVTDLNGQYTDTWTTWIKIEVYP